MEAAAVSASHGAMASLLSKLGDLLTEKYRLLKEAKEQIIFLKDELENMYAFLKKMSDTEEPDEQAKCWSKEVRELSYDIEDSVNDFLHRVEREANSKPHGFKGFVERIMNLLTTINMRHEITREFQGLKRRVMEVSERRVRYKVDDAISKPNNTTVDLRVLALHADTADLVGIDGLRDELIQLMSEENVPAHQLKALSIVGFGGLGKTTLANEIYRKLDGQFHYRAFVSVSQKPNIKRILRSILSQVGFVAPAYTNMEIWDENELISALQKFLLDKRYFIVIDDIWGASAWDIIRCALPENMNGSRVLTTTRIETVARACCTNHIECVYKMKALSDQDSRRLFFKRIFGSEDACPPYLKEVSAEILKKCGGLPLAIITTSSLLANQPNRQKDHWEYVRNSMGSNFEGNPSLEGMRKILNLSYINLPHHLKTCMLYLGIYPEDYTIHKNDLTRQWVAEGFISKVHGIDPEDVANSYFNELINRSMIQPTSADYNGEVMSCRVHDMILDLILHESREENFITVIDDIQDMEGQQDKIRRLFLNLAGAIDDRIMRSVQLSQTRTLARFGTSLHLPPFRLFKHLRVLTIEIAGGPWSSKSLHFTGICNLFQLRYLKIKVSGCDIVLPSKMGLQQLEVFELYAQVEPPEGQVVWALPSDIVCTSQLLHLVVPWDSIFPDGVEKMKLLRTLHGFNLATNSVDNIIGLRELTHLTDLSILDESFGSSIYEDKITERKREVVRTCLDKLCNLKYLCICPCNLPKSSLGLLWSIPASCCLQRFHAPRFSRIPESVSRLHELYDLNLVVKEVLEDDVGMLAQLPSLIHLYLRILGTPKDKIMVRGSGFPVLKHFDVGSCRISYLTFEAGAMPKLERLKLNFNAQGWDRYGAAPSGIEHLSALKEISVRIGGWHAKESNRRAAESALRNAIGMHPGGPAANVECPANLSFMFDDREEDEREEQKDDVSCSS